MWEHVTGGSARPSRIDTEGSKIYVRIRRDIKLVPATTEENPAHYEWEELKIPKTDYAAKQTAAHDTALNDVYAALTELAEIVAGGG